MDILLPGILPPPGSHMCLCLFLSRQIIYTPKQVYRANASNAACRWTLSESISFAQPSIADVANSTVICKRCVTSAAAETKRSFTVP